MRKKTIALGIDDFKEVIEGNNYFIDKSLLIKEAIEEGAGVVLLPRPRRWGKTLSMSMLRYFFEKTEQSNRHLFNGLAIEQYSEIIEHQGKYPVIFLTFKDAKKLTWQESYEKIQEVLSNEYRRHSYLLEGTLLDNQEKKEYQEIINKSARQAVCESSIYVLCAYLHQYHGVAPFLLIDEYDAPVHAGFTHQYYKEVMNFMRTFLGMALKGNLHLKKGFLTGILRVAKESVFSGLNNLFVCTILNNAYAQYIGFNESEVSDMLEYYECIDDLDTVRSWYNGYNIGDYETMYNPWSVLSYVKTKELKTHWMNSSDNLLIKDIVQKSPGKFKKDLEQLLLGNAIEKQIADFVTFNDLYKDADIAWNFLLLTGYVALKERYLKGNREHMLLQIPNQEVKLFYEDVVTDWIKTSISIEAQQEMLQELVSGNITLFKRLFERIVIESLSYHDVSGKESEKYYHMFVLGMLISLRDSHEIKSNRESGSGRYDVMIIPKDLSKIGIIIEFKVAQNETDMAFEEAKQEAFQQIEDRKYKIELESRGITKIITLAIIFSGKRVLVQQG